MMLEQINRRLAAKMEEAKKTTPKTAPNRSGFSKDVRHLPRHALRPPPRSVKEIFDDPAFPDRVQTPIVVDGVQIGIAHGEKPLSKRSKEALTNVLGRVYKQMASGKVKRITEAPSLPLPGTPTIWPTPPKEKKMPKPIPSTKTVRRDDAPGAKTIGVKVAPELYDRLVEIKKRHALKTIKDALLLAAERGVYGLDGDYVP